MYIDNFWVVDDVKLPLPMNGLFKMMDSKLGYT